MHVWLDPLPLHTVSPCMRGPEKECLRARLSPHLLAKSKAMYEPSAHMRSEGLCVSATTFSATRRNETANKLCH